jgi:hypothetical protein
MLLEKLDNYISESEKHDRVWREVTASSFSIEEIMKMSKEERIQIMEILDERTINKIKRLEEGGLI